MIKLKWESTFLSYTTITWSGSANQASRTVTFSIPWNPADKNFTNPKIKLGDLISLYDSTQGTAGKSKRIFLGVVTSRDKTGEMGEASYTAKDFMHYLLRSNGTYKFKATTPEKIAKKVCSDAQLPAGSLAKTDYNIKKMIFKDKSLYDIIIRVYRAAVATTKQKYMLVMDGKKVSVIKRGLSSGVTLNQNSDITGTTYNDNTDAMVDQVAIYTDTCKKVGQVKNSDHIDKYGLYQSTYTKEDGVNAKTAAKALLHGIDKTASIEAIGNTKCIAGYSVIIKDSMTGLSGRFYIDSDSHTFSNGIHTMTLDLTWNCVMEDGADTETETSSSSSSSSSKSSSGSSSSSSKPSPTNSAACYYTEDGTVYHSKTSCSAIKGKAATKSTVGVVKAIKITKGKNKGKRKYKACSKCWKT